METQNEKQYEFFKKSKIAIRTYKTDKQATTLEEAWRKTFEKWDLIVKGYDVHSTNLVVRTCGLCDVFYHHYCEGCPIARVGFGHCSNAEYVDWGEGDKYMDDIVDLARAELEFLKKVFNGTIEQTIKGDSQCQA